MKKILVGFDGSDWAHSAVVMASWLARQARATVVVLQAIAPPVGATQAGGHLGQQGPALAAQFRAALAAVEGEVAALSQTGVWAEGTVVIGEPVRRIMRAVAEREFCLVVVGALGQRPVHNRLLGSVADKLARSAPTPVLLMPQPHYESPAPGQPLRALVVTNGDGSNAEPTALTALRSLAMTVATEATIVQVLDHSAAAPVDRFVQADGGSDHGAQRYLIGLSEDARSGDRPASVVDRPAEKIIQFAKDRQCDIIALARSGSGQNPQMLLGRVAEGVVRKSSLPVLVVPRVETPVVAEVVGVGARAR